jgi:trigger factor
MEYTIDQPQNAKADIHLTFNGTDIEQAFEKAYVKAAPKVKIAGFRPGKAPMEMVKKSLGESVLQDAIGILLNEGIHDIYPKLGFTPYGEPKIDISKFERNETLVVKATYELSPKVELSSYKSIPVDVMEPEIGDEDIAGELKRIRFELSKTQAKEDGESIEENDFIEFDLESKDDEGVLMQQGDQNRYYLGINPDNKGLEDFLLGMKAGEEKDFIYTYEENYPNPDLANKKLNFHTKIHSIYKVILPELDDGLANEWDENLKTLDDLKNQLKESAKSNLIYRYTEKAKNLLVEEVISKSNFTIPDSLIDVEIEALFHETIHRYNLPHMSMEKFAEMAKTDLNDLKEKYQSRASQNIKSTLTLYEIAKQENIIVTPEEFNATLEAFKERTGEEKLKKSDMNKVARNLHDNILISKAMNFLYENADKKVVTGVKVSEF